jgi:hypothetical protein
MTYKFGASTTIFVMQDGEITWYPCPKSPFLQAFPADHEVGSGGTFLAATPTAVFDSRPNLSRQ